MAIKHFANCSDKEKWLVVTAKILGDFFLLFGLVSLHLNWNKTRLLKPENEYQLCQKMPDDLRPRILGNYEISGKSMNTRN